MRWTASPADTPVTLGGMLSRVRGTVVKRGKSARREDGDDHPGGRHGGEDRRRRLRGPRTPSAATSCRQTASCSSPARSTAAARSRTSSSTRSSPWRRRPSTSPAPSAVVIEEITEADLPEGEALPPAQAPKHVLTKLKEVLRQAAQRCGRGGTPAGVSLELHTNGQVIELRAGSGPRRRRRRPAAGRACGAGGLPPPPRPVRARGPGPRGRRGRGEAVRRGREQGRPQLRDARRRRPEHRPVLRPLCGWRPQE